MGSPGGDPVNQSQVELNQDLNGETAMRKVPAILFGFSTLAAFTLAAWSITAAVASPPASAALLAPSCPVSCGDTEENCVDNAICAYGTCADVTEVGCAVAFAKAPAPGSSESQCVQQLQGAVGTCQVQGFVCDVLCAVGGGTTPPPAQRAQ